jgi:hypothetical protein
MKVGSISINDPFFGSCGLGDDTSIRINGDLILDPNTRPPGLELRQHDWVLLKRFRVFIPSRADVHFSCIDGGFLGSIARGCGAERQIMDHIVNECLLPLFLVGLLSL